MSKKIKMKDLMNENFSTISTIGGVVTAKPFHTDMSLSGLVKEKYGEVEEQEIDVEGLKNELSEFNKIGEALFGKSNITDIAEKLSWIASQAKNHTLSETEDWFDKITINRNMKELTSLSKNFSKIAGEAKAVQERMSALYEDMGNILSRYYEINEKTENKIEEGDYEEFFQKAMKKFGISSPDELKDDETKKKFFNYVDANYKAKKETD
jgi:hypothetical protein